MKRTLVLILAFALACAAPKDQPAPQVAVAFLGPLTAADRARASDLFEHYLSERIHTPGASFRMARIGPDRASAETTFAVRIPTSWGAPNAVANRTAFIAQARAGFRTALTLNVAAQTDVPSAGGPVVLTVLPPLDSLGKGWEWAASGSAAHAAVVCDASPSAAGIACTGRTLTNAFDAWLPGGAIPGSSFRVFIAGTDIGSAQRIFEVTTPDLPLTERVSSLLGARHELAVVLERTPPGAGSAIAETLTVALDDLASRRGTKRLFVLSDLRQTTPGMWAFDEHVPTSKTFVAWLGAEQLLPDCHTVAIHVCGLHFGGCRRHSAFDARRASQLKAVWRDAFAAMHAASLEIHGACDADAFTTIQEEQR